MGGEFGSTLRKENISINNKHDRSSTSLIIMVMQNKTTVIFHLAVNINAKSKKRWGEGSNITL